MLKLCPNPVGTVGFVGLGYQSQNPVFAHAHVSVQFRRVLEQNSLLVGVSAHTVVTSY